MPRTPENEAFSQNSYTRAGKSGTNYGAKSHKLQCSVRKSLYLAVAHPILVADTPGEKPIPAKESLTVVRVGRGARFGAEAAGAEEEIEDPTRPESISYI